MIVPRRRARGRRRSEAGYNMAILVIAITVLNIMLAAALPHWSYLIRRDKEEELRSRGLQYAEAIRIFQVRFGRLPVRLQELEEVKPRSIRRLWRDPMTDSGQWGLIFQNAGRPLPTDPNNPNNSDNPDPQSSEEGPPPPPISDIEFPGEQDFFRDNRTRGGGKQVAIGPISGVHSLSDETSLASFFGNRTYSQWLFTLEILQRQSVGRPEAPLPRLDLRNLGRPFRQGLETVLAQPGDALAPAVRDLAGASGPGGRRNQGLRPGQPAGGLGTGGSAPGQLGNPRAGRPGQPRPGQPRPRSPQAGQPRPGFPGQPAGGPQPGVPGGSFPGAPGVPQPGAPGGGDPGGGGGGGTGGGGGGGGGGFDPTVPQNVSPSVYLPVPD